jgi:hypothetical protein
MNSPSILSRERELTPTEKLHRERKYLFVPEMIILDLEEAMRVFYEQVARMDNCDNVLFVTELDYLLDEIVMYISDINFFHDGIESLGKEIITMYTQRNELEDGKILAAAAKQLAHALVEQISIYRLYVDSGVFPYQHSGWLSPYSPSFSKNLEFV